MMQFAPTPAELAAAILFACALVHSFSVKLFERLAHRHPAHAGVFHLLGEVETVFGLWAALLVVVMMVTEGSGPAIAYVESRSFTEPLFVFAIMVVAASRPVLAAFTHFSVAFARLLPLAPGPALYFTLLAIIPLGGSLITEPAAMTLAAIAMRDRILKDGMPPRFLYGTLGVLLVNISIGGTLTPYAAPPVLMVARGWGWDLEFMLFTFGWKAAIAVTINAGLATYLFRKDLAAIVAQTIPREAPFAVTAFHLACLAGIVVTAHHPPIFLGLFLLFLGVSAAYPQYQGRLILKEGLMVAFFLAGLVVLGGLQHWWLKPLLTGLEPGALFAGATALTAITDNAALTYLGSTVPGLADALKYALVAGAVTGGGLTIIANAPNPAGISLLKGRFSDDTVSPLGLFAAALCPTLIAAVAFLYL